VSGKRRSGPVLAWRAWRIRPEGDQQAAPLGTLYGPMTAQAAPWVGGVHRATCTPNRKPGWERGFDRHAHKAPGLHCECGIRGDLDLAALFEYGAAAAAASSHGPALRAAGRLGWRDWREVIGEVELSGLRLPPRRDDTPTTLRAERARVGRRVFFARPLWDLTDAFEELHPWSTAVRVETLRDTWHYLGAKAEAPALVEA
jgi:hypothetical protein